MSKNILYCLGFFYALTSLNLLGQVCSSCNTSIEESTSISIHVTPGNTVCIQEGVECTGHIFMEGGVLCNHGTITSLRLDAEGGGEINNYSNILFQVTDYSLSGDLTINNFSGSTISSSVDLYFELNNFALIINSHVNSTLTIAGSINASMGFIQYHNGINLDEESPLSLAHMIFQNQNYSHVVINFTNSSQGSIIVNGSININECEASTIFNNGLFHITENFNLAGESSTNLVLTDEAPLNINTSTIIIDGSLNVVGGTLNNNLFLRANNLNNASIIYNNGYFKIGVLFDNSGSINLSEKSSIECDNYANSGTIVGVEEFEFFQNYPKIIIDKESQNNGVLSGGILVFDKSQNCSSQNNVAGFGFDYIPQDHQIASSIRFITYCENEIGSDGLYSEIDCSKLSALLHIPDLNGNCPTKIEEYSLNVYPTLNYNGSNIPFTYTIQPGNLVGSNNSNVAVSPTTTTEFTIYASYFNGCVFQKTFTVTVPFPPPSLAYSTYPFLASSTVNFPAILTNSFPGFFSISPQNSSVTINPTTGEITATGNSFGTYTVTYSISQWSSPEMPWSCNEGYTIKYVVTLENLACDITIPVTSFTLCPDDKVQFNPTATYVQISQNGEAASLVNMASHEGLLTWTPHTPSSNSPLSCGACYNPTLTFNGTPTVYTLTGTRDGRICGAATASVYLKANCEIEEIIGCCFSNYGAAVWINDNNTYVNVFCNLVNELVHVPNTAPFAVDKGEFRNDFGHMRVLLDWIHNAKNNLYLSSCVSSGGQICNVDRGYTILFGTNQKLKGNSSTHFNFLQLDGNGEKSIHINQYAFNNLDLMSNILNVKKYVFHMKNINSSIVRTSGYVSNERTGYFSWQIPSTSQLQSHQYLYPLGAMTSSISPYRYRPIIISNNSVSNPQEISANFMNIPPSLTTDAVFTNTNNLLTNLLTNQAPNVLQINNSFYHKIKYTSSLNSTLSDLGIKYYFLPIDGNFQSISEWENSTSQPTDWWGSTPGSSANIVPSVSLLTPNMIYAAANGTFNFNHTPFVLSKGGFYVNTNQFGNNNGNGTTVITLTATSGGGGSPLPSGGGLNNPFGTGVNSGNNGTGGSTIFTPNPVAGTYVMGINSTNVCDINGKIRFVINQNGVILPNTVEYSSNNTPAAYSLLSDDVYSIDTQNTGITPYSTPTDLLRKCINSITITTTDGDYVLDTSILPPESLSISLPSAPLGQTITFGAFKIYKASTLLFTSAVLSAGSLHVLNPSITTPGVYNFELPLVSTGINETLKGQLIIK